MTIQIFESVWENWPKFKKASKKSTDPSDVGALSFRCIIHFWYFCFQKGYKASLALYPFWKQKYQKWIIHRKPRFWLTHRCSTAVRSKKKRKISRGYSSFTVMYCVILQSIENSLILSGIVRTRFAPHSFLVQHAVSVAQLAKLYILYITYISVHRNSQKLNNALSYIYIWGSPNCY